MGDHRGVIALGDPVVDRCDRDRLGDVPGPREEHEGDRVPGTSTKIGLGVWIGSDGHIVAGRSGQHDGVSIAVGAQLADQGRAGGLGDGHPDGIVVGNVDGQAGDGQAVVVPAASRRGVGDGSGMRPFCVGVVDGGNGNLASHVPVRCIEIQSDGRAGARADADLGIWGDRHGHAAAGLLIEHHVVGVGGRSLFENGRGTSGGHDGHAGGIIVEDVHADVRHRDGAVVGIVADGRMGDGGVVAAFLEGIVDRGDGHQPGEVPGSRGDHQGDRHASPVAEVHLGGGSDREHHVGDGPRGQHDLVAVRGGPLFGHRGRAVGFRNGHPGGVVVRDGGRHVAHHHAVVARIIAGQAVRDGRGVGSLHDVVIDRLYDDRLRGAPVVLGEGQQHGGPAAGAQVGLGVRIDDDLHIGRGLAVQNQGVGVAGGPSLADRGAAAGLGDTDARGGGRGAGQAEGPTAGQGGEPAERSCGPFARFVLRSPVQSEIPFGDALTDLNQWRSTLCVSVVSPYGLQPTAVFWPFSTNSLGQASVIGINLGPRLCLCVLKVLNLWIEDLSPN